MAMQHARRARAPRAHEAATLASPTLHVILGGRRQLLSSGQRRLPTSQSSAPAGYRAGRAGVGYPAAESSSAAFALPKSVSIGTGDFTLIAHFETHTARSTTYNYLFGSNASYFALSSGHTSASGNAALIIGGLVTKDLGVSCAAVGEYRMVVRRIGTEVKCWLNTLAPTTTTSSESGGTLSTLVLNSFQAGSGYGAGNTTTYLAGVDSRAWSDSEVSAFLRNPSSIFSPVQRDAYYPQATAAGTITLNEITSYRVFEGAAGSAQVTLSGSHTGATDTIEYRIETTGGVAVTAWATLQASVAEGAFSGTVTVPRGGWYYARVRKASATMTNDVQAQPWGVGIILGGLGQSQIGMWHDSGTYSGTPDPRAVIHDGTSWSLITSAGKGRNTFAAQLVAAADCPVAIIVSYINGSSINQWYDDATGKTASYNTWESKVTAAGAKLSAMLWWQGEGDVAASRTKAQYLTDLNALISRLRTDYGATMPVVIPQLGRTVYVGYSDATVEPIRDAQVEASNASAYNYGIETIEFGIVDDVHYTDAGFIAIAQRIAQCIAHALGLVAYARSPRVGVATRVNTTTIDVTITHAGGTDITPSTGITGFQVLDNGTPATISGAVRQSANTVRLTVSAPLTGPVTVRYGYGKNPTVSGMLRDNTALAMGLETTDADVLAAGRKVLLTCIQRVGGAAAASITGLRWAFFDQSAPNALTTPSVTGTGESTDGSGVLEIDVIGTTLNVGDTGYLVTDTSAGIGFAGPVVVSG